MQALIALDEKITPEEEAIAQEIAGMVDDYANRKATTHYCIVIHPKNQEQSKAILTAIPAAKEECVLGDRAFVAGTFHTRRYAEIISESYREQGWFTVVQENSYISISTTEHGTSRAGYGHSLSSSEVSKNSL